MIKGHCFTNLDDFHRVEWPKMFAAVPSIGDRVRGNSVGGGGYRTPELKVVSIIHTSEMIEGYERPYIVIELHR